MTVRHERPADAIWRRAAERLDAADICTEEGRREVRAVYRDARAEERRAKAERPRS